MLTSRTDFKNLIFKRLAFHETQINQKSFLYHRGETKLLQIILENQTPKLSQAISQPELMTHSITLFSHSSKVLSTWLIHLKKRSMDRFSEKKHTMTMEIEFIESGKFLKKKFI